ncbi:aldehyde dehydrogenase family protein [Pseudonocardia sp. MCCB 268]|nr:aldehyde dehydrogenase family protein [Pseudonocardia cytotoxica]
MFADADLAAAANGVITGVFATRPGRGCNSGGRLLVSRAMHIEAGRAGRRARAHDQMGDPRADSTEMGPIAFAQQLDKVLHYVDWPRPGATVHCGGRRPGDEVASGYF